nr:isocitrate lyase/phosphoenolpyruvate mutase family protein [Streptomyces sp. SID4948]
MSPDLFVNARVDTSWLNQDDGLEATQHRAITYVEAGAGGIFVPGASDPALLRELTANIPVPLNVLVIPDLTVADLGRLGVRRISTGSLPYRAAIHAATHVATAVRDGNPDLPAATPYPDLQRRDRLRLHSALTRATRRGERMPKYQVIAHHTIAPGENLDEVLSLYPRLAAATRSEPGNVSFTVFRQLDDERGVVILERYASRDAFATHQQTPHFKDLVLDRLVPRLADRWFESYDVEDTA